MSVGPLSSVLETKLEAVQFHVALNHFRQALDSFARGNFEAAGGSIGSFLQNRLLEACDRLTGSRPSEPRAALDRLRDQQTLDEGQWNLLRGCWAGVQAVARHQGASNDELALLRLHVATAAGKYLVNLI